MTCKDEQYPRTKVSIVTITYFTQKMNNGLSYFKGWLLIVKNILNKMLALELPLSPDVHLLTTNLLNIVWHFRRKYPRLTQNVNRQFYIQVCDNESVMTYSFATSPNSSLPQLHPTLNPPPLSHILQNILWMSVHWLQGQKAESSKSTLSPVIFSTVLFCHRHPYHPLTEPHRSSHRQSSVKIFQGWCCCSNSKEKKEKFFQEVKYFTVSFFLLPTLKLCQNWYNFPIWTMFC